MKITALLAICSGLLAACASPSQSTTDVSSPTQEHPPQYQLDGEGFYHLLLGELALLNEEPETALYLLGEAQKQYPRERRLLERVAPLAAQSGNLDLALSYFNQWTEVSPRDTNAWHGVWQLAFTAGDTELAISALGSLLELSPGFGVYTPLEQLNEWQPDAIDQFYEQLLASDLPLNTDADLQLLLGYLAELQSHPDQANKHWQKLSDLLQGENDYFTYSQTLTELNMGTGAQHLLTDAISQYPQEPRLYLVKARNHLKEDDLSSALAALEFGLEQNPEDENLLRFAGEVAFEQGAPSARGYFKQLLKSEHESSAGHYYLGRLDEEAGEAESAFAQYQQIDHPDWILSAVVRVIQLLEASALPERDPQTVFADQRSQFPNKVAPLTDLQGRFWYDAGEYQLAFETYTLGLREEPDNFALLYMRALSAEPLDRLDDLEADLRAILNQDPDNTAALNALGYTLIDRTDRIEEAAPMIEQAHAQNPESYAIMDSLGWLRFKQGNHEEAVTILREALDMQGWDVDDDEVVAHYVEALWENGDKGEALRVAEEWLSSHTNTTRLSELLDRLEQADE